MENDTKKQSIITGFVNNTIIFYLLLVFLGYLSIVLYYNIFNFSVFEYYQLEDYVRIFLTNLFPTLVLIIMFLILGAVFGALSEPIKILFNKLRKRKARTYDIEVAKRNFRNVFYITTLFEVFITVYYFVSRAYNILPLLTFNIGLIIFSGSMFLGLILIQKQMINLTHLNMALISFLLFIAYINYWIYYAKGFNMLHSEKNNQNMVFNSSSCGRIITSDSLLYLGASQDYVFLFNKVNQERIIVNRSQIESIIIKGKEESVLKSIF